MDCQCTQTVNYFPIIIAIAGLFQVEYVEVSLSMTSHPLACVHFRDDLVHLHLFDKHFVLHPQLMSCILASGSDDKCFVTTFSPSVLYHQPIVSAGF